MGLLKPQAKLPGMHLVSNPSTGNQRILAPTHSLWYKSKMTLILELVVQISIKGIFEVEIHHFEASGADR